MFQTSTQKIRELINEVERLIAFRDKYDLSQQEQKATSCAIANSLLAISRTAENIAKQEDIKEV
ncbi:hypothetical protein [Oceanobacillus kimchii]|uniref:hypothetical protein n=1 Tax=Oceanobacillus kimchii TaxID=746691 RepID=UPI00034D61F4|nr:hypothetical protein [Oceanobacillus kimchii]